MGVLTAVHTISAVIISTNYSDTYTVGAGTILFPVSPTSACNVDPVPSTK